MGGPDLAERWGPGLTDDSPGVTVPPDWRSEVARWPHERWAGWRREVTGYLDALGRPATADEIRSVEYAAWCCLRPDPD